MEHWFDRLARDSVRRGLSRREVMVHGTRTLVAGTLLGATWTAATAPAAGGGPCGLAVAPECETIAREAVQISRDACLAETTDVAKINCLESVVTPLFNQALWQCLDAKHANGICGKCEICGNGECVPKCVLTSCQTCDQATGQCIDTCPPDQHCSATQGPADATTGTCVARCLRPCAPWDPALKMCRDTCREKNPCMSCRQGTCQSDCPDPEYCQDTGKCGPCDASKCQHLENGKCHGCDPVCEKCVNGTCESTCSGVGQTCCLGQCLDCCGSGCDKSTGLCHSPCAEGETCCQDGSLLYCKDISSSAGNCGCCGCACPNDTPNCVNGTCTGCPQGQFDCSGPGAPTGHQCCYAGQTCCEGYCCESGWHCCPGSLQACCPNGQGCCAPPLERCGC